MSKKVQKSLKIDGTTVEVIDFMVDKKPEFYKRKFNQMIGFFVETHPEFIKASKLYNKGKKPKK